jgi:hypothetical protein
VDGRRIRSIRRSGRRDKIARADGAECASVLWHDAQQDSNALLAAKVAAHTALDGGFERLIRCRMDNPSIADPVVVFHPPVLRRLEVIDSRIARREGAISLL